MEVDTVKLDALMGWLNEQMDTCNRNGNRFTKHGCGELAHNQYVMRDLVGRVIAKMEETFAGANASPAPMEPAPPRPMVDLAVARKEINAIRETASYGKVNRLLSPGVRGYYAGMETGLDTALALLKTAER